MPDLVHIFSLNVAPWEGFFRRYAVPYRPTLKRIGAMLMQLVLFDRRGYCDGKTLAFTRYTRQQSEGFGYWNWAAPDVWVGSIATCTYRQVTHMPDAFDARGGFLPDGSAMITRLWYNNKYGNGAFDICGLNLSNGTAKP